MITCDQVSEGWASVRGAFACFAAKVQATFRPNGANFRLQSMDSPLQRMDERVGKTKKNVKKTGLSSLIYCLWFGFFDQQEIGRQAGGEVEFRGSRDRAVCMCAQEETIVWCSGLISCDVRCKTGDDGGGRGQGPISFFGCHGEQILFFASCVSQTHVPGAGKA